MNLARRISFLPTYRYQPETLAYKANLGSFDIAERSLQHVDKFVRDCKEAGIWPKLLEVAPFTGQGIFGALVKLKYQIDPMMIAANFVVGDYTEATGLLGDGATKYIDTQFPLTSLSGLNHHISCYLREDVSTASYWLGANNAGLTEILHLGSTAGNNQSGYLGGTTSVSAASAPAKGFYYLERSSATSLTAYKDGTQTATSAVNTTPAYPPLNIFAFARNNNGAPATYANKRFSFFSIGLAMTAQQRSDFSAIVQTLQTNLGRAV